MAVSGGGTEPWSRPRDNKAHPPGRGREGRLPATLTACLHFCFQIRRHPSFKSFFYQLPDSSLVKLTATLRRQGARSPGSDRNPAERPYPFAFGLANSRHSALSLMGLRYPQFPYREAPQVRDGKDTQGHKQGQGRGHDWICLCPFPPAQFRTSGVQLRCHLLAEAF